MMEQVEVSGLGGDREVHGEDRHRRRTHLKEPLQDDRPATQERRPSIGWMR